LEKDELMVTGEIDLYLKPEKRWWSSSSFKSFHHTLWVFISRRFCNFQAFSITMVTKKGWNVLHNPDSLVAKLLKAKYFPHSTILEANLGCNLIYSWRSIWNVRDVLLRSCWSCRYGLIKQIISVPFWGMTLPEPWSWEFLLSFFCSFVSLLAL